MKRFLWFCVLIQSLGFILRLSPEGSMIGEFLYFDSGFYVGTLKLYRKSKDFLGVLIALLAIFGFVKSSKWSAILLTLIFASEACLATYYKAYAMGSFLILQWTLPIALPWLAYNTNKNILSLCFCLSLTSYAILLFKKPLLFVEALQSTLYNLVPIYTSGDLLQTFLFITATVFLILSYANVFLKLKFLYILQALTIAISMFLWVQFQGLHALPEILFQSSLLLVPLAKRLEIC